MEKILLKTVQSFFLTNWIYLIIYRNFENLEYVNQFSVLIFTAIMIMIFGILFLVDKFFKSNDDFAILLFACLYFLTATSIYHSFYFALSGILILSVYFYHLLSNHKIDNIIKKFNLFFNKEKNFKILIGVFSLAIFLFISVLTILRNELFRSSCFDFGIFSQMFYYLKIDFQPFSTCERNLLLNHFNIHLSPIFYSILPLYLLFPHPNILLLVQNLPDHAYQSGRDNKE